MADSWETTVDVTGISTSVPNPTHGGTLGTSASEVFYYSFVAADLASPLRYFTVQFILKIDVAGTGYDTVEVHGWDTAPNPDVLGTGNVVSATTTAGDAAFAAGGTLAITKNETLSRYEFSGPLGLSTVSFATVGSINSGELSPFQLFASAASVYESIAVFPFAFELNTDLTVTFENFYGKLNGTNIKGATLASGDRGSWTTAVGGPVDPFNTSDINNMGGNAPTDADTASGIGIAFTERPFPGTVSAVSTGIAEWDLGVYMTGGGGNPFSLALDAVLCRFSGNLYVLRVASTEPEEVFFAVSRDRGASWQEQSLSTIGGGLMVWPTLDVDPTGKILALWQDRNEPTRRYWTVSETYGQTWLAVQSEVVTAFSSQRARYHPMTGWLFYVFRNTDALQLQVAAYDAAGLAGFTAAAPWATPRLVTAATAENWPTVNFDRKGEVQLQWAEMQHAFSVSENLGVDWTTSMSGLMTTKDQPSVINDDESGLQYVLYQHPSTGDLSCFASDDGAVNALAGGPAGTVVAAADQQYAAVVTDHRGHVYAIYQELSLGSYTIRCRRSDSLSSTWVNA